MEKRNGFNVGDKVVFIDDFKVFDKEYSNLKGQTGVVAYTSNNTIRWKLDIDGEYWSSDPEQLQPSKNHIVKAIIDDLL